MAKFSDRLRKPSRKIKLYEDNKEDSTLCRVLPYCIAKYPAWISKSVLPIGRTLQETYIYNNSILPSMYKHNTFKLEQL